MHRRHVMLPDPEPTHEELMLYAGLLAWIMESKDERGDVEDTAVHVWRVELTVDQHERLQQFRFDFGDN